VSIETIEKIQNPWERIELALSTAKGNNIKQSYDSLWEKKDNGIEYCSLGYLDLCLGEPDAQNGRVGKKSLFINNTLEQYGFSKEERNKNRLCPEPNCLRVDNLACLVAHINDEHKIPLHNMGHVLRTLEHDDRKIPSFLTIKIFHFKQLISSIKSYF